MRLYQIKPIIRLITGYSHLNAHKSKTIDDISPNCDCLQGKYPETPAHFLLFCEKYSVHRQKYLNDVIQTIIKHYGEDYPSQHLYSPITINLLLVANELPVTCAISVLKHTYLYIQATKRDI